LETDACTAVYINSKMTRVQITSSSCRNDKSMAEKEKDHEEVLKIIQKHQGSSVLVFTDGSGLKTSLFKTNISVIIAWVPAHDKIEANEKVDRQAKEMAYDIFKENISATQVI